MKGSIMLFVTSILLLVFGGLILITVLAIFIPSWMSIQNYTTSGISYAIGYSAFVLIIPIYMFIMGIFGIRLHKKPEKAHICFKLGLIPLIVIAVLLVLVIAMSILNSYGGSFLYSVIMFIVIIPIYLVVPILYTIGAYRLKNN